MSVIEEQITSLNQAVLARFEREFPDYSVKAEYPDFKKIKKLPAIFVTMQDFQPNEKQPGTGQLAVRSTWEARAVIRLEEVGARIKAASLAAEISKLVHDQGWGELPGVCLGEFLSAEDDNFDRLVPGVEVWTVTWEHTLWLGQSDWEDAQFYPENREVDGGQSESHS